MTFPEFVDRMQRIIGTVGKKQRTSLDEHARNILIHSVTDDGRAIVEAKGERTMRDYANGNSDIGNIVCEISEYLDRTVFSAYISDLSDEQIKRLRGRFQEEIKLSSSETKERFSDELADLLFCIFDDIEYIPQDESDCAQARPSQEQIFTHFLSEHENTLKDIVTIDLWDVGVNQAWYLSICSLINELESYLIYIEDKQIKGLYENLITILKDFAAKMNDDRLDSLRAFGFVLAKMNRPDLVEYKTALAKEVDIIRKKIKTIMNKLIELHPNC